MTTTNDAACASELVCDECADTIDENAAPHFLDQNGIESDGAVLCEGCADDQLESTIAWQRDTIERGLDYADEYA